MDATKHQTARQVALERFERATELPLLILALAMIPLLLAPAVVDLSDTAKATVLPLDWFIWAAFALEYVIRLALTEQRARFIRKQWSDLLIIVLPFLRPLRIMRSARALRLLRLARLAAILTVVTREGRRLLTRHKLHYALLATGAMVVGCALLVHAIEDGRAVRSTVSATPCGGRSRRSRLSATATRSRSLPPAAVSQLCSWQLGSLFSVCSRPTSLPC
jgi:hypothetical protein